MISPFVNRWICRDGRDNQIKSVYAPYWFADEGVILDLIIFSCASFFIFHNSTNLQVTKVYTWYCDKTSLSFCKPISFLFPLSLFLFSTSFYFFLLTRPTFICPCFWKITLLSASRSKLPIFLTFIYNLEVRCR